MQGRVISTVYLYGSSKELCLAIPTNDLVVMGIPFKACFVQIDIQDIVNLLAFDDNGKTSFGLYSQNGGNLSNTELGNVISTKNIFEATKDILPEETWEKFRNDFKNEAQGSVTINLDGVVETLSYVPVPGTGWHMVVLIRESVINEQIRTISEKNLSLNRYMITIALVAMLIFSAILLLQLRSISAEKLEAEKENSRYLQMMANFDSMTGVRNKHAYTEIENALNEQIHNKELDKLAVVVCDVNGLKYVNDTLGHEAGDKLIKDASAMICEHFNHGSVFRVGGDEFVVLLQGRGYELLDESTREFNKAAEDHIKSNEVVVSIGYSKLEFGDEQLSDVFGRADQMMYERKKELKGMGAKTRE
ncbi:MAG: diguanylate cyclase [Lachnospiraceae bacterium]|nr:diguanylate cyclase [Lachnospiraceae bacterium]